MGTSPQRYWACRNLTQNLSLRFRKSNNSDAARPDSVTQVRAVGWIREPDHTTTVDQQVAMHSQY